MFPKNAFSKEKMRIKKSWEVTNFIGYSIPFFLLSLSCSRQPAMTFKEWSGVRSTAQPEINFKYDTTVHPSKMGSSEVLLTRQMIAGAAVEGSFLKKVSNSDGQVQYLALNYIETNTANLEKDIADLNLKRAQYDEFVNRPQSPIKNAKWISPAEVVVAQTPFGAQALVKVDYESDDGIIFSLKFNKYKNVVDKKKLGSFFETAHALVFPDGPKKSELMDVLLTTLLGDGTLRSDKIQVTTATPDIVSGQQNSFNFPPPDHRFDQVQVFYFINRFLGWVHQEFNFVLPFQVKVVTHLGFPQKTNAAFYYHGEIRLGEGDDDVYSKILYDSSIVTHETGHAFIDAITGLPFQGEGGSINEGLADFLACSHLKSPYLGEVAYKKGPFKRTVLNKLKLAEGNGGLYHDSGIVSGTLWQIKETVGETKALKVAFETLLKLNPASTFKDFGARINESAVASLVGNDLVRVKEILAERGWN